MRYDLPRDLEHIAEQGSKYWSKMQAARICLSGGTGFFGKWLLDSFLFINEKFSLGAELHVLSRNSQNFLIQNPQYKNQNSLYFYDGSVIDEWPISGTFTHVIHAAAGGGFHPAERVSDEYVMDNILYGTRRALEFCVRSGSARFLYISSGAAYGRQPLDIDRINESYFGAPIVTDTSYGACYGEAKRISEILSFSFAEKFGFQAVSSRCFAFVGPHLAMDKNFAIGNFIKNVVRNEKIVIQGDGTPIRSYLYAADLALQLWVLLLAGQGRNIYNVGSENSLNIQQLAWTVREALDGKQEIEVLQKADPLKLPERYVPSCLKFHEEFGLKVQVPLVDAIRRTAAWYRGAIG